MEYRFLHRDMFPQIYAAFIEAFSDYSVKMQPSQEQLLEMLTRRGARYDLSVGAFVDERMVGFNLNGFDLWNSRLTVYDTGTGVIPAYRGQNIAAQLFEFSLPKLRQESAQQYLLEVIDTNLPAIKVYKNAGFREARKLECFTLGNMAASRPVKGSAEIEVRIEATPDWEQFQSFWDWQPSWQNSINSIKRSQDHKVSVCAFSGGNCVGYGTVYPSNGDIPQLAVHKEYRRRGVGARLLQGLSSQISGGQTGRMINVDGAADGTLKFCEAVGMQKIVSQYEMLLELRG